MPLRPEERFSAQDFWGCSLKSSFANDSAKVESRSKLGGASLLVRARRLPSGLERGATALSLLAAALCRGRRLGGAARARRFGGLTQQRDQALARIGAVARLAAG